LSQYYTGYDLTYGVSSSGNGSIENLTTTFNNNSEQLASTDLNEKWDALTYLTDSRGVFGAKGLYLKSDHHEEEKDIRQLFVNLTNGTDVYNFSLSSNITYYTPQLVIINQTNGDPNKTTSSWFTLNLDRLNSTHNESIFNETYY